METLDEPIAQGALDRLFTTLGLESALAEVILPFLHTLGERWARGETSVAQEHFASNIIGGRLRALAGGWGNGVGPRAVLACMPGERHDLGLLCFGLALRERGWRIVYLGAETPLPDVGHAVDEVSPAVVVLCAVTARRFREAAAEIAALARRGRVAIGGAGASPDLARELGAEWLGADAITAAAGLVDLAPARG